MMMQDVKLRLCERGLIPGPNESEENFWKRVKKAHIQKYYDEEVEKALQKTKDLYNVRPDWAPLLFSNKNLAPWEGACCWIDDDCTAFIQMRYPFQRKKKFLYLYDKSELLAHEFVHAARSAFEEAEFEEFLAYQTSNKIRAYFGSLIRSTKEVILFFITFILGLGALFYDNFYFTILPLQLFIYALVRAQRTISIWKNARSKFPASFLFRLSDKEIRLFAKLSKEEAHKYIDEQKKHSFRWKIIANEES